MKHFKGFSVIMLIAFLGECAHWLLPFAVPASIYAFAFLFVALQTKLIAEETIAAPAGFLIEIMPILFVPAAVGILDVWGVLQQQLIALLAIVCGSTLLVAYCTGAVAQRMVRAQQSKEGANGRV